MRDGMSPQQREVFHAVTKLEVADEAIIRQQPFQIEPPGTSTQERGARAIPGCKYSRGLPFKTKRTITASIGTNGWGFLLIDHRLTAWSGVDLTTGTAWVSDEKIDSWTSTSTWTGNFSSGVAWSSYNPSTGVTGVMPVCSLGSKAYPNPSPSVTGDYGAAVLGQRLSLVTMNLAVLDRQARMWTTSTTHGLPTTMNFGFLEDNPRVGLHDGTALTAGTKPSVYRNPHACGTPCFMVGGHSAHATSPGQFHRMALGFTLIVINGPVGSQFTFCAETVGVHMGSDLPVEFPICANDHAFSIVCCALAAGIIDNTSIPASRSKQMREAYREAEHAVARSTPSFVAEAMSFLGQKGIKLAGKMANELLSSITL